MEFILKKSDRRNVYYLCTPEVRVAIFRSAKGGSTTTKSRVDASASHTPAVVAPRTDLKRLKTVRKLAFPPKRHLMIEES